MIDDTNFVDSLNRCLALLEWSIEDLAREMNHKYSSDYLRRVREGKLYSEVEQDIAVTVLEALADKVEASVVKAHLPEGAGHVARQAFARVVRQFELHLNDIARLAETLCDQVAPTSTTSAFRTQTVDLTDSNVWNSVLQEIARDLTQRRMLLAEKHDYSPARRTSGIVVPSESFNPRVVRPFGSGYYRVAPDACYYCRQPTDQLKTAKCTCGKNWNTPD